TQEVFVRAFKHRHRLRPGRELLAWLYRVGTNLCLNRLRDARSQKLGLPGHATVISPEKALGDRDLLRRLLQDLSRTTAEIVFYVLVDGMTHDEAAKMAGISARTVRNRLREFRQSTHLRINLEDFA